MISRPVVPGLPPALGCEHWSEQSQSGSPGLQSEACAAYVLTADPNAGVQPGATWVLSIPAYPRNPSPRSRPIFTHAPPPPLYEYQCSPGSGLVTQPSVGARKSGRCLSLIVTENAPVFGDRRAVTFCEPAGHAGLVSTATCVPAQKPADHVQA